MTPKTLSTPLIEPLDPLLDLLHHLVLLQQNRHHDDVKRPRPGEIDTSLYMELGTIKEAVESGLIGFGESMSKWCPPAVFILDQLTEWRKGFAHAIWPPAPRERTGSALFMEFIEDLFINNKLI
jgi:hypothetical protein